MFEFIPGLIEECRKEVGNDKDAITKLAIEKLDNLLNSFETKGAFYVVKNNKLIPKEVAMKTCKELGWKVGDKFRCIKSGPFILGEVVELVFDDGTSSPKWEKEDCDFTRYANTDSFEPLVKIYGPGRWLIIEPNENKYVRTIHGVDIDVYDVLNAWEVTCPATQHAIKKLLMPGQRGSKDKLQDLEEAGQAVQRAIELEEN